MQQRSISNASDLFFSRQPCLCKSSLTNQEKASTVEKTYRIPWKRMAGNYYWNCLNNLLN